MAVESYAFEPSNREDLSDVIYMIDPTETPFVSGMKRETATNRKHEWLKDSLVSAAINFNVEGAQYGGAGATFDTRPDPDRLHTYTQIWAKNVSVTGTQEAIEHAGRDGELSYQIAKMGVEIRRDMEYQFTSMVDSTELSGVTGAVDGGSVPLEDGSSSVARLTGSLPTWITGNRLHDGSSADPGKTNSQPDDNDVAEPGTARAFLESYLKEAIRLAYVDGGNPTTILVDPFNKQVVSSFTGGTTKFDTSEDRRLVTAIDVYVSDFGEHMVIPDRFLQQSSNVANSGVNAYVLDMEYWALAYLRPFMLEDLAKVSDSEDRVLLAEAGLCSKQEEASAIIRDLTYS